MMLPNLSYQILLALVYYGNDAQARTDIRKRNEVLKTDFSKYHIPNPTFSYTNEHVRV